MPKGRPAKTQKAEKVAKLAPADVAQENVSAESENCECSECN